MQKPNCQTPHRAEAVICLHCSASSGAQWRALREQLCGRWNVFTPNLLGYSSSLSRKFLDDFTLDDELDGLTPVLDAAGDSFHLVGHSYGGLVAFAAAMRFRERIASLTVYEPAAWSVVIETDPTNPGAQDVARSRQEVVALVESGRPAEAARVFVSFWAGECTWEKMPESRKALTAQLMAKVRAEYRAEEKAYRTGSAILDAYRQLRHRVLYLVGEKTCLVSQRLAQLMASALPHVEVIEIPGAGHMAPAVQSNLVNHYIEKFLTNCKEQQRVYQPAIRSDPTKSPRFT